ncbi:hypothetical protein [Polyangium sp. 15x6]|uniref:hypothetical protein n=1 Tax=Polyangium sp. 15x6 TaxID=3042687 RepID=UPI00249AD1DB|nr:hypothetical protein [Polyangium sp. 15x6]MDI3283149.1 hypothetical protein [Polyangium sp. 15x6]
MSFASPAPLFALALLVTGCNVLGHTQLGPTVASRDGTPVGGVEANANMYVDMQPADDFANRRPLPETARRWGLATGAYLRGSPLGVGLGMRPGIFVGSTDAKLAILGTAGLSLGLQTLEGTTYGNVGLYGMLAAGIPVRKTYDPKALVLCRSLTYVTIGLQGHLDRLPALEESIGTLGLLVGVLGLEDSGAPSDRKNPDVDCPR